MKIFLAPPGASRPSLIVETHATITPQVEQQLRSAMYERSCANGMLFDTTNCVVLRDTYDDMGPQSVQVDLTLRTDDVLSLVQGPTLDDKVVTWLALLSVSWNQALAAEPAVAELMYDIVPAAVGTEMHIVRDVP